QPTGSFKIRNGMAVLFRMAQGELPDRIVTATRGNHGLGLCWAARKHGVDVSVVVPKGNSISKNAALRALGAQLIEEGSDYEQAVCFAKTIADQSGAQLVSGNEDLAVLAGAGTM